MDTIWGEIAITPLVEKFLDIYEFQRMRNMKQLGACNFVYSCAESSRFAHSLGVYHLARELVLSVHRKDSSLLVTDRLVDLISIAALYHDIGHGPFSHLFDKITNTRHEERSQEILRHVVKKYGIAVSETEVDFMCQVIDPKQTCGGSSWLFQIVSNGDIDVDRMDYLVRDSYWTGITLNINTRNVQKLIHRAYVDKDTSNLVYPDDVSYVAEDLLNSRQYMFDRVYLHHAVEKINKLLEIAIKDHVSGIVDDIETFLMLSDSILHEIYFTTKDDKIKRAIDDIYNRNF